MAKGAVGMTPRTSDYVIEGDERVAKAMSVCISKAPRILLKNSFGKEPGPGWSHTLR